MGALNVKELALDAKRNAIAASFGLLTGPINDFAVGHHLPSSADGP